MTRELAVGFLYHRGADPVARRGRRGTGTRRRDVQRRPCNVVRVTLSRPFDGSALKRNFFATSSCGICGKATLEQVAVRCPPGRAGPGGRPVGPRRLARTL